MAAFLGNAKPSFLLSHMLLLSPTHVWKGTNEVEESFLRPNFCNANLNEFPPSKERGVGGGVLVEDSVVKSPCLCLVLGLISSARMFQHVRFTSLKKKERKKKKNGVSQNVTA